MLHGKYTTQLEVHLVECIYLRQQYFDVSKPRVAASTGAKYQYVGFSWRNKIPRCSAYNSEPCVVVAAATGAQYGFSRRNKIPLCSGKKLWEKAICFRHPDLDQAQKLISSSMSQHLSTCNISSKSMHEFWSNLAHRQTDKRTRAKTYTSFVVGGK